MSLQYIFHVAFSVTFFTLFLVLQFFVCYKPDCNDLTAEIKMVLSLLSEVHTRTLLQPQMLCLPLFRKVCAIALITIKKILNLCQSWKLWQLHIWQEQLVFLQQTVHSQKTNLLD